MENNDDSKINNIFGEIQEIEDNIEEIEEIDENNMISQYKLLSSLFGMQNNSPNIEDNNELSIINNKIDSITNVNDLIYEEACALTISNDTIKDEIETIKNSIDDFKSSVDEIQKKLDIIISSIGKLNI